MSAQHDREAAMERLRLQFGGLPEAMTGARRWLLWRREGNGPKPRKVPYYSNGKRRGNQTGGLDTPEDIAQLCSFEHALVQLASGGYSGLGFALGPDGQGWWWQGIDLDGLSNSEQLRMLASDLPGYTETSPSGDGKHAIGYGSEFQPLGSNTTGIEAYCSGRFFTVTGDSSGGDICDLHSHVTTWLRPLHEPKARTLSLELAPEIRQKEQAEDVLSDSQWCDLREALGYLDSDSYDPWIANGMRLKSLGKLGFDLWIEWSRKSQKFDPAESFHKWETFCPTRTFYKAIFTDAQSRGWKNPQCLTHVGNDEQPRPVASPHKNIGDLIVSLEDYKFVSPEHPHIVERLFPEGEVTLMAGHGGSGKSYISLVIAIHVCLGLAIGGLKTRRGSVLFFSAEDGKDELLRRVARICEALGRTVSELNGALNLLDASEIDTCLYAPGRGGRGHLTPLVDELADVAEMCGAVFIIIDNASDTYEAEEHVRRDVRAFVRGVRQKLACRTKAVLLLAHVSKLTLANGKELNTTEDYSGSTAWHNSARSRLSIKASTDGAVLVHYKANRGPRADPLPVVWRSGVPTICAAENELPGAEIVRQEDARLFERQSAAVLEVLQDFTRRGERVPTANKGAHTAFSTLRDETSFPVNLDGKRFTQIIRSLERTGAVCRKKVQTEARKVVEVFEAVLTEAEPAPAMAEGVDESAMGDGTASQ